MTSTSTRSRGASRSDRRTGALAELAGWASRASQSAKNSILAQVRSHGSRQGAELARPDEDLLEASRTRVGAPLDLRDRWTSSVLGGAFLATALTMAVVLPWREPASLPAVAMFILGYAVVSRVEFEVGTGSAVPTELLFVPMLFALPTPIVPLCVASGYLLGASTDYATGRVHPQRFLVLLCSCWYAVGPVLALSLARAGPPSLADWPIYLAALAAQFGLDLASSAAREWFAFGNSPRSLLPFFAWVYAVDTLLAPIGLVASFAGAQMGFAFLLVLPLVGLLALLAHDRRARIDRGLAFSRAYQGASQQARSDPLTGLGNRLAWEEALSLADLRRTTSSESASVIIIDVNHLKLANDTRGHEFGDDLLRAIAGIVRASVRGGDIVVRIGGDEFGILMLGSDQQACLKGVARLGKALDRHPGLDNFKLSAAIGHATCPPAASAAEAARSADIHMYQRKVETRA
jgi:diguanylate cyclase (GGDEF)-like protein